MNIRYATTDDVGLISTIAAITWPATYGHILSKNQLDYMLERMYNHDVLIQSMTSNTCHFLITEDADETPLGFAGFRRNYPEQMRYRLDKLYVLPEHQGKGIGKALLSEICKEMKTANAQVLELNVNRYNHARLFYEKLGFTIARTEDIDIGNGFLMNDYVMELHLV
jgi:ribosomal protein S18 acetylase RimI-like enzyme